MFPIHEHRDTRRIAVVSEQNIQKEIQALKEAYAKATQEPYYGEDRVNEMVGQTEAADNRGEIDRLQQELNHAIDELEHTTLKLLEKTAPVAAMDRSIPSEGEDAVSRTPETKVGGWLYDSILRVRHIQNRLNEHIYKLEL